MKKILLKSVLAACVLLPSQLVVANSGSCGSVDCDSSSMGGSGIGTFGSGSTGSSFYFEPINFVYEAPSAPVNNPPAPPSAPVNNPPAVNAVVPGSHCGHASFRRTGSSVSNWFNLTKDGFGNFSCDNNGELIENRQNVNPGGLNVNLNDFILTLINCPNNYSPRYLSVSESGVQGNLTVSYKATCSRD